MAINAATKLGQLIGKLSSEQDTIKQNISPDDTESQEQVYSQEEIILEGTTKAIKWNYGEDSFILDHPVYGYIDSNLLRIDGGYASSLSGFSFPGSFPLILNSGTAASTLIFSSQF
jgi:hypothetical protein